MVAGGGVSENWAPPEQGRRRPVTRLLFLRGPLHGPGGAGQRQAVCSTRVREPEQKRERLAAPGRKAECGGRETRPPHSTASSQRWPGWDCMVRAYRRVPPAARLLPCRGLRATANSWGRWLCYLDAAGCSAPPPRSRTLSPTEGGHRAARDGSGDTAAGRLPSPAPPGSPASNARRDAPPRPRPLRPGLEWWATPPSSPRVPAHCPAGSASP